MISSTMVKPVPSKMIVIRGGFAARRTMFTATSVPL
jgi:hypothetical protein